MYSLKGPFHMFTIERERERNMELELLESSVVVPSKETPSDTIWLSNLDLLVARAHTPTVYFYRRPSGESPDFFSPERLREALAEALVHFYPLAGRLAADHAGRLEIRCTGEGVRFLVAQSNSDLDRFGDFAPSDEMSRLLVPSAESGNPPCELVMAQVTFFKCGGVCLGIAVHHTAADGLGALHFVNSWSNISRGIIDLAVPPFLDRSLLHARSPPSVLFDHVEYSRKPLVQSLTKKPSFDTAILKLTKYQINSLKNKGLSTFKAIVAHVWRTSCLARRLTGDQETRLLMTVDGRSRVRPPLPRGYLGNAIFRASATAKAEEIVSNPIEFGAEKIQTATSHLDDNFVRSLIDYLELQEDVRGLTKGKWVMPETDLWVISWQGLPIYDADFGWGKPEFMGRACLQFSGLVYIMQSPGLEGGISVAVALEPENMPRFKKLFYEELGGDEV